MIEKIYLQLKIKICSHNINEAVFVFQIGGLVVFSIGVYTLVERSFMTELLGSNLYTGTVYVLVVTSALVCILSFFGCMGAAREIKCLLLTVSNIQILNDLELHNRSEFNSQFLLFVFNLLFHFLYNETKIICLQLRRIQI